MSTEDPATIDQKKINFLFSDNHLPTEGDHRGYHSTLRLARNDIETCRRYGQDNELIFPWASTLMSAIDLCATLYAGECRINTNAYNFKKFVNEVMFPEEHARKFSDFGEVIYNFRNGIMHSYRIIAKTPYGRVLEYSLVCGSQPEAIVVVPTGHTIIDVKSLTEKFTSCLTRFKSILSSPEKIEGATRMFDDYGWMGIGVAATAGKCKLQRLTELLEAK